VPGWPTVDRAGDRELAALLRHADPGAPERLYTAYGERLYDYARSLLGEHDRAADAVHDALVTAQERVDRLRENTRLRAWLYALTRFQAMARLSHRGAPRTPPPAPEDPADPELTDLVRETLGELSGRETLELSVRHGLTPAEAGAVLGLTSRQTAARLARARDQLENAAAAVVLARNGRAHCPALSAMLDSWEGPLSPPLRRRLSGHIGGCEVCTERRHRQVAAERLLDLLPLVYPPLALKHRVVGTCADPELGRTRTLIADRGDGFDRAGFPLVPRRRRPRRLAPVALVGACLLAAAGVTVVLNGQQGAPTAVRVLPSATPDEDYATDDPEPVPETEAAPTPRFTGGRTDTPAPSGRPPIRVATTRPPAPPTTRRPIASAARLSATCPSVIETEAGVRLLARHATITWSAGASAGLGVSPTGGSIRAGGSVTVRVTVEDPGGAGSGTVSFSSNGGGARCSLSWRGDEPTLPVPSDEPTPDPEPTQTPTGPSDTASAASAPADPEDGS